MVFRRPNSWFPMDGYDYHDPADGAGERGLVARDQHGACLVPWSRRSEVASIMVIEPPDRFPIASDLLSDMAVEPMLDPQYEQMEADDLQIRSLYLTDSFSGSCVSHSTLSGHQDHQEFVVFGQVPAYPAFVVQYSVAG